MGRCTGGGGVGPPGPVLPPIPRQGCKSNMECLEGQKCDPRIGRCTDTGAGVTDRCPKDADGNCCRQYPAGDGCNTCSTCGGCTKMGCPGPPCTANMQCPPHQQCMMGICTDKVDPDPTPFPPEFGPGQWCSWKAVGPCSTSFGPGVQAFRRRCDCPPPGPMGKHCPGLPIKTEDCGRKPIPWMFFNGNGFQSSPLANPNPIESAGGFLDYQDIAMPQIPGQNF